MKLLVFFRTAALLCLFYVLLESAERCSKPNLSSWFRNGFSGTCIKVFKDVRNWNEARSECQKFSGDLVIVNNRRMQDFVYGLLTKGNYWIGFNDIKTEGRFTWLDSGEQTPYNQWARDNPDNYHNEDCTFIIQEYGDWNDAPCSSKQYFICEVTECESQTFGVDCSKRCNENCHGTDKACHHLYGSCLHGCDAGYQGHTCDKVCDDQTYGPSCTESCNENCNGTDNACHHVDGSCLHGCDDQMYGASCTESCSPGCNGKDNTCDRFNGSCLLGCDAGYLGPRCDKVCENQTYGVQCLEHCSPECTNNTCDHVNGSCLHGCNDGYLGPNCDKREADKDTSLSTSFAVVILSLPLLCAILFAVGVIFTDKSDEGAAAAAAVAAGDYASTPGKEATVATQELSESVHSTETTEDDSETRETISAEKISAGRSSAGRSSAGRTSAGTISTAGISDGRISSEVA